MHKFVLLLWHEWCQIMINTCNITSKRNRTQLLRGHWFMIEDNTGFPSPAGLGTSKPAHFNYRNKWCCRSWFHWATLFQLQLLWSLRKPPTRKLQGSDKSFKITQDVVRREFLSFSALKEQCNGLMRLLLNPLWMWSPFPSSNTIQHEVHLTVRETLFLTQDQTPHRLDAGADSAKVHQQLMSTFWNQK